MTRKTDMHHCVAFVPYKTTDRRFSLQCLSPFKDAARDKFVRRSGMSWKGLYRRGWRIVPVRISQIGES